MTEARRDFAIQRYAQHGDKNAAKKLDKALTPDTGKRERTTDDFLRDLQQALSARTPGD